MELTAPIALVTGASSGIGRATAAILAKEGFRVFGTSRSCDFRAKAGGAVTMIRLDPSSTASIDEALRFVEREAGPVNLLVNNAGTGLDGAFEDSSMDQIRSVFEANVFGAMRLTKAVLPGMRSRNSGRLIHTGSVQGFIPAPYRSIYAATKHAIEGWSTSLDHETRAFGIRSIVVEPGHTNTRFNAGGLVVDEPTPAYAQDMEAFRQVVSASVASGDTPETVARVILRAATANRPRLRYPAGKAAGQISTLSRLLPPTVLDRAIRSASKIRTGRSER